MNYSHYFQIQHHPDEVSMDEFIAEAMRTDIRIENNQRTIDYLNTSRITLSCFVKSSSILLNILIGFCVG